MTHGRLKRFITDGKRKRKVERRDRVESHCLYITTIDGPISEGEYYETVSHS